RSTDQGVGHRERDDAGGGNLGEPGNHDPALRGRPVNLARIVRALEGAGQLVQPPATLPEISGVTEDSRKVKPGTLFCAVRGSQSDGHRFIPEAIRHGAAALIVSSVTSPSPSGSGDRGEVPAVL